MAQDPSSTLRNPVAQDLIRRHGGKVIPYSKLPAEARSAIDTYMDGAPDDARAAVPKRSFGLVHVPTHELASGVMSSSRELRRDHKTFDRYHRWYMGQGDIPNHGKSVWPAIFSGFDDELFEDGWHRFHSYVKNKVPTVPVVWFPESEEPVRKTMWHSARELDTAGGGVGEHWKQPVRCFACNQHLPLHDANGYGEDGVRMALWDTPSHFLHRQCTKPEWEDGVPPEQLPPTPTPIHDLFAKSALLQSEVLAKVEPVLAQHLKTLRQAAPDSADFLARRLFTDTMVPGVGNKLAYNDFLARPRGGVHVLLDGNDFGQINKRFGQSEGDTAIKAMGGALSRASRQHRGKLFRVGGDEFRLWFEKPEQAHLFLRTMHKELGALPPAGGVHFHSVSAGIGPSPEHAEQALLHAKDAKKAAGYAPGHALTHVHSLLPGAVGPVGVRPAPEMPPVPRAVPAGQSPLVGASLRRSEPDPEVEELKRRANAIRLAKMAVIHDDPQNPTKVWRVQNQDGRGPYHAGGPAWQMSLKGDPKVDRPDPFRDFEMNDIDDWGQYNEGEVKFGFQTPEHAERWFGPSGLSALRQHGFTLHQVLARKVWRSQSGRQVMFEAHE